MDEREDLAGFAAGFGQGDNAPSPTNDLPPSGDSPMAGHLLGEGRYAGVGGKTGEGTGTWRRSEAKPFRSTLIVEEEEEEE